MKACSTPSLLWRYLRGMRSKLHKAQWWCLQAIQLYSRAIELDGSLLVAYNNRAMASLKLGEWQKALQDCKHVLSQEPGNVKALLRQANARCGRFYPHIWFKRYFAIKARCYCQLPRKHSCFIFAENWLVRVVYWIMGYCLMVHAIYCGLHAGKS